MKSKVIGDYGVSLCATYFLHKGYQVLMPYGDRGHYDLVVEKYGTFQRIQCKWTSSVKKPYGYPVVSLSVCGSVKKENNIAKRVVHRYSKNDFDMLWVATPHTCYLIPLEDILHEKDTIGGMKLYPKWDRYRVAIPIPTPSENDCSVKRASPRLTEDDKATIKRLVKEGRKQQDIADILNVTRGCISAFLSRERKNDN